MKQQVSVGKVSDSMEKLEQLCNEKAEQMATTMTENVEISFWTADIPELICIAKFCKGEDGKYAYTLDFSQSTL